MPPCGGLCVTFCLSFLQHVAAIRPKAAPSLLPLPPLPKGGVNFTVCARFDPSLKVVAAQTEHPLSLCLCLIVVVDVVALLLCSFVLVCHFSRRCVAAIFNLLQLYGRASASATASNKFFFICLWLPFLPHHSLPSSLTVKLSPVRNAFINKVKSLP